MKKNRVKELWREGRPAVMGWCSSGNPYIAEIMAHAGFDAVTLDWQHGIGVSQSSLVSCIQAIGNTDTMPMVRVPKNEPDYISYVLDAGAYGVIVSHGQHTGRSFSRGDLLVVTPPKGIGALAEAAPPSPPAWTITSSTLTTKFYAWS